MAWSESTCDHRSRTTASLKWYLRLPFQCSHCFWENNSRFDYLALLLRDRKLHKMKWQMYGCLPPIVVPDAAGLASKHTLATRMERRNVREGARNCRTWIQGWLLNSNDRNAEIQHSVMLIFAIKFETYRQNLSGFRSPTDIRHIESRYFIVFRSWEVYRRDWKRSDNHNLRQERFPSKMIIVQSREFHAMPIDMLMWANDGNLNSTRSCQGRCLQVSTNTDSRRSAGLQQCSW
jgi:hypothetical protein